MHVILKDRSVKEFKEMLAETIICTLQPIRDKLELYRADPSLVEKVIRESQSKVRHTAEHNIKEIKRVMGMYI